MTIPGHIQRRYLSVATQGFISGIPDEEKAAIALLTAQKITPSTDFLVFDPKADQVRIEDQGRTMIIPYKTIPHKVYVKLDDYGSIEALSKDYGRPIEVQYKVTFMLAEEY